MLRDAYPGDLLLHLAAHLLGHHFEFGAVQKCAKLEVLENAATRVFACKHIGFDTTENEPNKIWQSKKRRIDSQKRSLLLLLWSPGFRVVADLGLLLVVSAGLPGLLT